MPSSTTPGSLFKTDSSRWAALQTRNPLAASCFIYCVTSTNICCRPTCKARLARRSNVIFHDTYADAAAAGFRACKRCRPELQTDHDPQADAVARACRAIEDAETGMTSIKLGDLAKEAGLTKSHFHRVFKKVTGMTPRVFAGNMRAERMSDADSSAVAGTPELVASATLSAEGSDGVLTPGAPWREVGLGAWKDLAVPEFQDWSFDGAPEPDVDYEHFGLTAPTTDNHASMEKIEYTVQPWASGFVLIAATKDGVCWLEAGNSVAELSLSLAKEFPLADLVVSKWPTNAESGELENWKHGMFTAVMEGLVRPTGKVLNVPFDLS